MNKRFEEFAKSSLELEIWSREEIIYQSEKSGVAGLLDFIAENGNNRSDLVVFDKIVGRGAALLAAYIGAKEIFGVMGSELAIGCLKELKISFHFNGVVDKILNKDKSDMCPIEKMSLGMGPEAFYRLLSEKGR